MPVALVTRYGSPVGAVDSGESWTSRIQVRNNDGILATPDDLVVTVTLPDRTTATVPVVAFATGVYDISVTATLSGQYIVSATAQLGDDTWIAADTFDVDQVAVGLVSLDDALRHLNMITTSDSERDNVAWIVLAATAACESYCRRPLTQRVVTDVFDGSGPIFLRSQPIVSVSSVTEDGIALTGSDYFIHSLTGQLIRGTGSSTRFWNSGWQNVSVTYVAGYADPPADLRMAVLREVEHLYQRVHVAPHGALQDDNFDEMMRDVNSAIPYPIRYMLDRYRAVDGFA